MNKVITISREFGSGGRELGRRLSELLHIAYYDQEILTEIAKRTELAESYIEQVVEQTPMMSFPIHVGRSFYPMMNPAFPSAFLCMQIWKAVYNDVWSGRQKQNTIPGKS